MPNNELAVAICHSHAEAEQAGKQLQHQGGIDIKTLSIVAKNYHTDEHVVGFYTAGDLMKRCGFAVAECFAFAARDTREY